MPYFSDASKAKLDTCDVRLQELFHKTIELVDITIIIGQRGEAAQQAAFLAGRSRASFPNSRHNSSPSQAVDWAPWGLADGKPGIDWQDRDRFLICAGIIFGLGTAMGLKVRNGADWKRNGRVGGNGSLDDLGHTELRGE